MSAFLLPKPGDQLETFDNDADIDPEFESFMTMFCKQMLNPKGFHSSQSDKIDHDGEGEGRQ